MDRRIARSAIWLAMIGVGLALVLDAMYFVHGSLELYPTEEDHDKVRRVTGTLGVVLASVEVGLWLLLRWLGRASDPSGTAADGSAR